MYYQLQKCVHRLCFENKICYGNTQREGEEQEKSQRLNKVVVPEQLCCKDRHGKDSKEYAGVWQNRPYQFSDIWLRPRIVFGFDWFHGESPRNNILLIISHYSPDFKHDKKVTKIIYNFALIITKKNKYKTKYANIHK